MPNPKRLLETLYGVNMQDGGSLLNQFAAKSRGASSLPGYGEGAQDIQQALAAIQESPAGRIASGVGEFAEGYMSGAGSTDLQKIGQGLSMIPVLGLPATVSKTIKTARVGDAITDSLRAKYPNVDISVAGDNTLYLGKMVVPKEQRNQGIGTQVMNDLVKQADDIGATVTLSPSADFGGNKEKLKEFYKRFGFVQNTGKNKDFAISESMYRTPQENLPTNFSDLGAMATQAYADYKANPNQLNALRYQRIKKAADDAYVKTQATPSKPVVTNEDYRGLHTAPTRAGGAPLHDLTQTYPDDIYSSRASQYYGHGEPRDAAVVSLAQSFKGRPHQMVTVYRAVPKNAKDVINAGDWVTIDRPYAKSHGESALRGDYKILSKRVRANEIFTNGDSIYEWGYDPVEAIKKAAGGAVKRVHISDNPDTMLLELTRAPRMQEGGKPPPGVRRAMSQQRGTVAPIPGIKTPAEFIGGYVGAEPRYGVMDPDADALERAYRAGEATSVIGDIIGSITPFATASTLARANALPGAAVVKAGAKKQPNVMAEFEKALAKSGPPTPAQIKKADAAEEQVKKEKKFAKLRPSEQRQAIEAARAEALGTTVDRSSKVLKALLPGEEDIMTSLQGIKGYEVAKAVPAYAVKEAKVKRAKLREEPPTTPGANASEKEWQDWGKQFGVDMTLSKPVSLGISDPVAKREVKIPGGLEGTFTIPDMFWMKANNVNPAALPKDVHDKLMLKFIRTHTVAEPDEVDIFNRLNFALLSPNAPLTSNEFLAMRARIRDKDELERLAARSGEEGLSKKMAEELGVQSGAKGGMGVLGTADLANQAELARMILQKPEMFMIQPGETMRDVTMRVMNQVPGLGPKTASLATPWLDLERANTSAVDLHMIRDATPRLLTDPDVGPAFRARMGKLLGVEPTVEAILAQPANKVQEKAVQIVGGSDVSKVYRTKTGALNEIPEAALPEKLVYEPSALSNFNPFYSKVVEYVDESRGANPVLELFPEQWRKWDVIRERIEPHEFAHPDYRKLPKQSFSEMKAASDEHTAAGYRGQRPVMDETDWRKLYYGSLAPLGVGLGAGALSEMDTGTD